MPRGRRGPELSPQMRSRICELHTAVRYGARKIHKIHLEIPLSTISYTIKKERERINNHSKARSGGPRKLTEEHRDHLYDMTQSTPNIKYADMLEGIDHAVCKRSIQLLLKEMNIRKWRQLKRPELTSERAIKRLAWARRWEGYSPDDFAQIIWSDECTVERGVGREPLWSFQRPRQQLLSQNIAPLPHGKAVKQMFWAAFSERVCTGLVPLDGDPEAARGGVTARIIRDLYQAFLPEIVPPGSVFMHDNAPVHRAGIVQDLLQDLGIEVMTWPPYSPDLNPIENLWSLMKREIYIIRPSLATAPNTEAIRQELIEVAKEAWNSIEERVLKNLSQTMPHRVEAVLEVGGWYTKY